MSSRHLSHTTTRFTALTATMLAFAGMAWTADEKTNPAAEQALKEFAQSGADRQGATAAASYYYDHGMKAMAEGRMDEAIHDLTIAVDWQPQEAKYNKALSQAQAIGDVPGPHLPMVFAGVPKNFALSLVGFKGLHPQPSKGGVDVVGQLIGQLHTIGSFLLGVGETLTVVNAQNPGDHIEWSPGLG